jgi:hypothetical protein
LLYVYALLGEAPHTALGLGLAGEPLRLVACGAVHAVTGELAAGPSPEPGALRAHDSVVRAVAAAAPAVLPVRFGTLLADEATLAGALRARAAELGTALALVAGREQMTVRLFGEAAPAEEREAPATAGAPGPGTRYLGERLREQRRSLPAIERLRTALAPLVHAARVEPHDTPPLLASVYHLVSRGSADRYRAALAAACADLHPLRVAVTGPWPPYAFAPGLAGLEAVA